MTVRRFLATCAGAGALALPGCSSPLVALPGEPLGYAVVVIRTEGGIPHVEAGDFASLGYGIGYAVTRDNLCLLAENFLRFRGELSRHQGAGAGKLQSDFFFQLLRDRGLADEAVIQESQDTYLGYADGYNRAMRESGIAYPGDPNCLGVSWLLPVGVDDVRRVNLTPFFLPGFLPLIVAAAPPGADSEPEGPGFHPTEASAPLSNPLDLGSNALVLGRDATSSGHGIVLANPHFPWFGPRRFYAMHQTLRGDFDVLGAMPVTHIQIGLGNNRHVAWAGTYSAARRHSFYRLELVPGRPTAYRFDGEEREMIRETVTVSVLRDDGALEERSHSFYSTHFGFMVESPGHPWSDTTAYALRTAELAVGNNGANGGTLGMYRARSVGDVRRNVERYQSIPVNLLAADVAGDVYYAESGPVAHVTDAQLAHCADARGNLDGSRQACQWGSDPDATAPGIFGPGNLPKLLRSDYATQSNDSYWLVNEAAPITGIPSVVGNSGFPPGRGGESSERTLRTRSGFEMVAKRLSGRDGRPGNRFTREALQELALANRVKSGQLLRDDLVTICRANPLASLPDGRDVDLDEACDVLAAWDLHANLESRGAHLFREFVRQANDGNARSRWLPTKLRYTQPFDPAKPLDGPRGLRTDDAAEAVAALGAAVATLRDAGIDLDARLGDVQHVTRNERQIPMHGGPEMMGVYSKLSADFMGAAGYPEVTGSSSSWIQLTELLPEGPRVAAMLTYSQSTNPDSPHFSDLTEKFSRKQWTEIPFEAKRIRAAAIDRMVLVE